MTRTYLVELPKAEARHLAGVGPAWPATPEARALDALREWLHGISRSGIVTVAVSKIVNDLNLILNIVPVTVRPVRGPLSPDRSGPPPGRTDYLGGGTVRLDETAVTTLAGLRDGEDFRINISEAGPILTIGNDHYVLREELLAPDTET